MKTMSTKSQERDMVVATYSDLRPTIPDLLIQRQVFGIGLYWRNHQNIALTELANRVAWNSNRMQNMILSVGPKTPASLFMNNSRLSSNSYSRDNPEEEKEDEADDDEEDAEDQVDSENGEEDPSTENQENSTVNTQDIHTHKEDVVREEEEDEEEDEDEDDYKNQCDMDHSQSNGELNSIHESSSENQPDFDDWEWRDSNYEVSDVEEDNVAMQRKIGHYVAAMRHGGCINTAAWLTCPWRLSLCGTNTSPITSYECSTQIITSGDDRLIKFWDVSYAMGSSSPLPGGIDTCCPFSSNLPLGQPVETWESIQKTNITPISGSVLPLATLRTGHFGNVFHVTPLHHEPGKIVTCGADGLLQCSDLISGTSSIIMHSENRAEEAGSVEFLFRRPKMCFSHHFIDSHCGLLCSQRGLLRFDIRIRSRDQPSRPILTDDTCKACALWSTNSDTSAYVFGEYSIVLHTLFLHICSLISFFPVGGASADVILYDLRMVSDSDLPSKIVQKYRPRGLCANAQVSISGICVSKNSKELLVSYENDQIYTFPICSNTKYSSGPTVDELTDLSIEMETKETIQRELSAYGGHLNRYTFLKVSF
jgi:hypothetical protein